MWKFALGAFLAAHGLIHLGYLTPAPADPRYPFNLGKSWLITSIGFSEPSVRFLGMTLSIVTVVGFALTGLAATGIIVPPQWGLPLTVVSSIASLLLLVCFWHTWLVLGVAIDVALLVALLWLGWQPFSSLRA
jgi:hypothetical protein